MAAHLQKEGCGGELRGRGTALTSSLAGHSTSGRVLAADRTAGAGSGLEALVRAPPTTLQGDEVNAQSIRAGTETNLCPHCGVSAPVPL